MRRAAARALCRIGDSRALRPIMQTLYAEDYWLTNVLLRTGHALNIPGVREEMLTLIREGTAGQRYWAIEALTHASGDAEVLEVVTKLRHDPDTPPELRAHTVAALCRLQPDRAGELLTEAIDDAGIRRVSGWAWWIAWRDGHRLPLEVCRKGFTRDVAGNSRRMAGRLALRHGDEGRALLDDILQTGSPDERATAAVVLAGETPEAFEVLLNELIAGYRERKWSRIVARVLVRTYGEQLCEWAEREKPDTTNRPGLQWALAQVRLMAGGAAAEDVLHFGTPAARAAAVEQMAKEQGAAFLPELRTILREGRPKKAARAAFDAMIRLRDDALATVQQMRTSEHWTERKAAVAILRRWGKLTDEQKAEALADPHVAVQHAADWSPGARAAAQWHPKWKKKINHESHQ